MIKTPSFRSQWVGAHSYRYLGSSQPPMSSEILKIGISLGSPCLIYVTENPRVGSRGLWADFREANEFTGKLGIKMSWFHDKASLLGSDSINGSRRGVPNQYLWLVREQRRSPSWNLGTDTKLRSKILNQYWWGDRLKEKALCLIATCYENPRRRSCRIWVGQRIPIHNSQRFLIQASPSLGFPNQALTTRFAPSFTEKVNNWWQIDAQKRVITHIRLSKCHSPIIFRSNER